MSEKILLLTASYGNGHISASNALSESLKKKGEIVEAFDIASQTWGGKFLKQCFNSAPLFMIEFFFDAKNYARPHWGDFIFGKFLFGNKIRKILKDCDPDRVICTFPLANTEIRRNFSGKISVYITDYFSPHLSWGWGNPDEIFCLDSESKMRIEKYFPEISAKNIHIQKFPLSSKIKEISGFSFQKREEIKKNIQQEYSLSQNFLEQKIFLLFFHHVLFGNEEEILNRILNNPDYSDYFICIIAGKNSDRFVSYSQKSNIHVFSWIENIEDFYAIAESVAGKCGGAFLSEVIFLDLPLLITGVFSGQEKGNKKFLEENYSHKLIL